jgi:hypothetical protein
MALMREARNLNWAFALGENTALPSATTIQNVTDLADGVVVAVNPNNGLLPAAALTPGSKFKLIQRVGTELFTTPVFTFKSATGKEYVAPTQLSGAIGSNGTTTTYIDPSLTSDTLAQEAVGNSYYVLITKKDNDEASRQLADPSITGQAKLTNPNSLTDKEHIQIRLGELLRESIRTNDKFEAAKPPVAGPRYLRVAVRQAGAAVTAASGTGGATATLVYGSKTVTLSAAPAGGIVAGAYLSIAGDIYRVAGTDTGNTILLDFPYAGPNSNTLVVGTTATTVGFIAAATVAADTTGVGLAITGTPQHQFDVDRHRIYSESRFEVRFAKEGEAVNNFSVATVASEGSNNWRVVAGDIYTSFGNFGQRWVSDIPAVFRTSLSFVNENAEGFGLIDINIERTKPELMSTITAAQRVRLYIEYADPVDGVDGTAAARLQTIFGTSLPTV